MIQIKFGTCIKCGKQLPPVAERNCPHFEKGICFKCALRSNTNLFKVLIDDVEVSGFAVKVSDDGNVEKVPIEEAMSEIFISLRIHKHLLDMPIILLI